MMAVINTVLLLISFSLECSANYPHNEVQSGEAPAYPLNGKFHINKHSNSCQNRTWLVESQTGECECAGYLDGRIYCDRNTKEVFINSRFCMSYDASRGEEVIGRCPYVFTSFYELNTTNVGLYIKLPANVSELEHLFCDHLNREGYFCSKCKRHHGYPMYPDFIKCVECDSKHYTRNWVLYIFLCFGPLTAFLILVVCLRISATSAPMNAFVFVSQIISLPPFERQFYRTIDSSVLPHGAKVFMHFLHSVYGLWNLNFFTTLIPPFCLPHQHDVINIISFAYFTALYPLLLLIFLYILIELHSKNIRLLVLLWKPFRLCYRRFQRQWDIRSSIIDAFATFFLLSYVKYLFITFDLFAPTKIWSKNGSIEITSYFNANIKLQTNGKEIFALTCAILISLIFVILPTVLLLLYPCRCFQKSFTRCGCLRFRFLHFLMDSFLGSYKDGTNGTWDCRHFAFAFLLTRIAICVQYVATYFHYHMAVLLTCSIFGASIAVAQPYNKKYAIFNRLDPLMILFLIIWVVSFTYIHEAAGKHVQFQHTALPLCFLSLVLPMALIIAYWLLKTAKKWYQQWICEMQCHTDDSSWYQRPSHPYTPQHKSYGATDSTLRDTA